MTQSDPKRKKAKKPPDRKEPPPPADGLDEAAGGDLNVVNLALWAGDLQTARDILDANTGIRGTRVSAIQHPVLASLQRLYRQLVRRLNEYTALAESAELPVALRTANAPLRSRGGHLHAMIWAETERNYELRCYLRDLSWEQEFYSRAAGLAAEAGVAEAPERAARLGYGLEEVPTVANIVEDDDEDVEAANDIAWATPLGVMFLQPEVSDFCTCSVRGVWTAQQLPSNAAEVIEVFQKFIDGFDPAAL